VLKDVATRVLDPSKSIAEIGVENLARALMKPRRRVDWAHGAAATSRATRRRLDDPLG
jgi:hypothetical protein